jgi:hypothetical protein
MADEWTASGDDLAYAFKPSLIGAAWEFRLRAHALEWQTGGQAGSIPYDRIVRMRLSFRPVSMVSRRFVTEIWPADGARLSIASSSWRSLIEQTAQDQEYGAFVRELHRRMVGAGAGVRAAFETGAPALLYWPGLAVFTVVALGLAALAARALQVGALAGAAFVGGFFALFVWQSGTYFQRNRPGRYRPDALPADLVPGAS